MDPRYDVLDDAARLSRDFVDGLDARRVGVTATVEELHARLDRPLTDAGEDPRTVVADLARDADPGIVASAGPRYFGFVIGGALPVTVAADWMTSAWDQNCGIFVTSPLISVTEEVASAWILELFGLPADGAVGFVTGCQMANFTCLAVARNVVLRNAGWNVEEDGLAGAPRVNIVVSAGAHVTIHTALRMLGFGTRSMIEVP